MFVAGMRQLEGVFDGDVFCVFLALSLLNPAELLSEGHHAGPRVLETDRRDRREG